MADLLAGTTVNALNTPPTVENTQTGSFTFNATTYGIDADAGTYVDCGVAFTACTTGRALMLYNATMVNNTAGEQVAVAPVVRDGGTVGAGATVLAATNDNNVAHTGTSSTRQGVSILLSGLTAGNTYNVRLEHLVSAGVGTLLRRNVIVAPAT